MLERPPRTIYDAFFRATPASSILTSDASASRAFSNAVAGTSGRTTWGCDSRPYHHRAAVGDTGPSSSGLPRRRGQHSSACPKKVTTAATAAAAEGGGAGGPRVPHVHSRDCSPDCGKGKAEAFMPRGGHDEAAVACWSCNHRLHRGGLICMGCERLQPLDTSLNFFELLDM